MNGIDPAQLRALIIRPALIALGVGGDAAEELMLGTILQESAGGRYLHQLGAGPAIGICETEPNTHDDIWVNFLAGRHDLKAKMTGLMIEGMTRLEQLVGNLYYAVAMARMVYLRAGAPLPDAGDLTAQAAYYKLHYNTPAGAATEAEYIANWRAAFPTS